MSSDSDLEIEDLQEQLQEFEVRNYQREVLEQARQKNIIAFLDTGTGKTLIALLLIKETRGKSIFLAPHRHLITQHSKAADSLGIPNIAISGETADNWNIQRWKKTLQSTNCMIMTPQIYLNSLRSGYLNISDFSLMIFDECHHCSKKHPYMNLMLEFYHPSPTKPKVLGLTASPVIDANIDQEEMVKSLQELRTNLDCDFAPIDRKSVEAIANKPNYEIKTVPYEPENPLLKFMKKYALEMPNHKEAKELKDEISSKGFYLIETVGIHSFKTYLRNLLAKVGSHDVKRVAGQMIEVAEGSHETITKRVEKLLKVLKEHLDNNQASQAIVLTERRVTAWYLSLIINYMSLPNIKSKAVIGKNNREKLNTFVMESNYYQKAIEDFRKKKYNLLVSTTVIEEGLDIPSCDLVVRFDNLSTNLRSYVQSKGRARDMNSRFLVLAPKDLKGSIRRELEGYEKAITWLKNMADTELPSKPTEEVKPLKSVTFPTGAKVSANWSVQFLKMFCNGIPCDKYTRHSVRFNSRYYRPGECKLPVTNSERGGYLSSCELPKILNCGPATGETLYEKEENAKADSALVGVKALREKGLINEYLKPVWDNSDQLNTEINDEYFKLVDERGTRFILKDPPLNDSAPSFFHQDISFLSVKASCASEFYVYYMKSRPKCTENSDYSLGVLSPLPVPSESFQIYPKNLYKYRGVNFIHKNKNRHRPDEPCQICDKYPVSLTPTNVKIQLDQQKIKAIRSFHIINHALITENYNELLEGQRNGLIQVLSSQEEDIHVPVCSVPIKSGSIDWPVIQSTLELFSNDLQYIPRTPPVKTEGKAIITTHNNSCFIVIKEIEDALHFEFDYKKALISVKDYYLQKHQIQLRNGRILQSKPIQNYVQALRPHVTQKDRKDQEHYIPLELSSVLPIPAEYLILSRLYPNIYHKLTQLFLTNHLSKSLSLQIRIPLLMEALTCTSALEKCDYQRLETLGDSVLKYLASEFLYRTTDLASEGVLSSKRSAIVCNSRLFNLALERKFYMYMFVNPVRHSGWKAPELENLEVSASDSDEEIEVVEEAGWEKLLDEYGEIVLNSQREKVALSNKQLADCVEALIGAAFLEGGFDFAKRLLYEFKLIGLRECEIAQSIKETDNYESLEEDLGYVFKDKGWLVEALEHSSTNKAYSYERLEFLGDAILDMVVMEFLFFKFPRAKPGSLSKMKSEVVNNKFLAYIATQLKLYFFLREDNPNLQEDVLNCAQVIEEMDFNSISDFNKIPDEDNKVLGDLFEAVIGAIYMDSSSFEECKRVIIGLTLEFLEKLEPSGLNHPHSRLFEWAQKNRIDNLKVQRFKLQNSFGTEFITKIFIREIEVAEGRHSSKYMSSVKAVENFIRSR